MIARMVVLHARYAIWILISAVAGIIASQADTLVAFSAGPVVNELFKELNPDFLLLVPIFVFTLVMSKQVVMYIHGLTMGLVTTRVTLTIRNRVYRHYLRFSLKHFDKTPTGEMIEPWLGLARRCKAFDMNDLPSASRTARSSTVERPRRVLYGW